MGNRVTLKFHLPVRHKDHSPSPCAYYLHWNGGPESTNAFFNAVFDFMNERNRANDLEYFQARFIQTVGHYMGDVLSFGVIPLKSFEKDKGGGMDNPGISYDISQRAPEIGGRQGEKYQKIYHECLSYLRSTVSTYDCDQKNLDAVSEQIVALQQKYAEMLEQQTYKENMRLAREKEISDGKSKTV